jgi:hypothetical protein
MAPDFPESRHLRRPQDLTSQLARYVHDALKWRERQDDCVVREYYLDFEAFAILRHCAMFCAKQGLRATAY